MLERVREVVAALKVVSILCGVALVLANNAGTPLRGGCVRRLQVGGLLTGRVVAILDPESQKLYTATLLRTHLNHFLWSSSTSTVSWFSSIFLGLSVDCPVCLELSYWCLQNISIHSQTPQPLCSSQTFPNITPHVHSIDPTTTATTQLYSTRLSAFPFPDARLSSRHEKKRVRSSVASTSILLVCPPRLLPAASLMRDTVPDDAICRDPRGGKFKIAVCFVMSVSLVVIQQWVGAGGRGCVSRRGTSCVRRCAGRWYK